MRILLVEDDPGLGELIRGALKDENFVVDLAATAVDGAHLGDTELYDAVILDLGLPDGDGISVLNGWRRAGRTAPVIVLTAREGWADKVAGFTAGADDYMTKPFRIDELVIRLRALIRRANGHAAPRVTCGALGFEAQLGLFDLDGLPLKLTSFEWRILAALMLRKEAVVERSELVERVYGADSGVDSNSLDVVVGRLRRKIGAQMIETVRGRGYRLTESGGA